VSGNFIVSVNTFNLFLSTNISKEMAHNVMGVYSVLAELQKRG
jgi:hypothetical protein